LNAADTTLVGRASELIRPIPKVGEVAGGTVKGTGTGLLNEAKDTALLVTDAGGKLLNLATFGTTFKAQASRTDGRIDGAIALGVALKNDPVGTGIKLGESFVAPFAKAADQLRSGQTFEGTATATEAGADLVVKAATGGGKFIAGILTGGLPKIVRKIDLPDVPRTIDIDLNDAGKGTRGFDLLNGDIQPNATYKLSNGNGFTTNEAGRVDSSTFQPVSSTGTRDGRQTAVGKEGIQGDVGGHIQACSLGGTCDRFNLFPQNGNFNNSSYKRVENEIRGALERGENVGPVKVEFIRADPKSARPDGVRVTYTINGERKRKTFKNAPGG
jgi:hypothetical protein